MAIAKEVPSGNLGEIPDGWHFYDPDSGDELKAVDQMRDTFKCATAMVLLPHEIAAQVIERNVATIPDEDLAGKGREGLPHITIKYGVREDLQAIAETLAEFYPFEVTLGKTRIFPPNQNTGGAAVVYVEVITPIMQVMHDRINETVGARHDGADYVPHVTLAYVAADVAEKYDGLDAFDGMKFTASRIAVTLSSGKRWTLDLGGSTLVAKAADEEDEDIENIILDILKSFEETVLPIQHELASTHLDQGKELRDAVGLESDITLSALNERALAYAKKRAAEMVGKRWVGGELVDNPNAKWVITETTRNVLRELIQTAFREGQTPAQLTGSIERTGVFSSSRADMIASTEMARAQVQGALSTAKDVGVVGKSWETSGDHDLDDECDDNVDDGVIGINDLFTSGDDGPPGHPNCNCAAVFYTADDPETADLLVGEAA